MHRYNVLEYRHPSTEFCPQICRKPNIEVNVYTTTSPEPFGNNRSMLSVHFSLIAIEYIYKYASSPASSTVFPSFLFPIHRPSFLWLIMKRKVIRCLDSFWIKEENNLFVCFAFSCNFSSNLCCIVSKQLLQ